ncbi:MAG: hypothetical protein MJ198_00215 [Bacteroidales bacterium]|nr:hypothetical protein [Bacteroidales bacterium]
MKKRRLFRMLSGAVIAMSLSTNLFADTYNPKKTYQKGDEVIITVNDVEFSVVYINDKSSANYNPSTPYDVNNGWLWSVSNKYEGTWVPYHYVLFNDGPTIVNYGGNQYQLLQEMWPTSATPSEAAAGGWGWKCLDCVESSVASCPNPYSTDYFPISLAQQNNGADNTTPANASGGAGITSGEGGNFVYVNQQRSCNTPFALYNNDILFRDACDPHSGLGYYGVSDNTNVPAPQKRLFADTDTDGPVLYGWNGGALGVRQRKNLSAVNGPHIEKIALQWTPSTVFIGTEKLPMLLTSYSTVSIKGLTGTTAGFYVSGTEKTKAISIYDATNKKSSFVVYGNGVVNAKKIYAEEIEVVATVNGNKWPDYVFEEDYDLKSLDELDSFIKENKHLPGVPSAEVMKDSGMNLAEMNATLLQKLEEMTLYIIDLQGQINTLKKAE